MGRTKLRLVHVASRLKFDMDSRQFLLSRWTLCCVVEEDLVSSQGGLSVLDQASVQSVGGEDPLQTEEVTHLQLSVVHSLTEIQKLQAMVPQLQAEKEELTRHANTSSGKGLRVRQRAARIPSMPSLVPPKLAQWMEVCQAELQDALSNGDDLAVLELSSKLGQGAERMVQMKRMEMSDDELSLRAAPGEGRFAPY